MESTLLGLLAKVTRDSVDIRCIDQPPDQLHCWSLLQGYPDMPCLQVQQLEAACMHVNREDTVIYILCMYVIIHCVVPYSNTTDLWTHIVCIMICSINLTLYIIMIFTPFIENGNYNDLGRLPTWYIGLIVSTTAKIGMTSNSSNFSAIWLIEG